MIGYQMTDFSGHNHTDRYLFGRIYIYHGRVIDALHSFREYGCKSDLDLAATIRDATGDTLHFQTGGWDDEMTIRWQINQDEKDRPYACRLEACGFSDRNMKVASKLAKVCNGWNTKPDQVLEALKSMKARPVNFQNTSFNEILDPWDGNAVNPFRFDCLAVANVA
jgi:hypothetical protein